MKKYIVLACKTAHFSQLLSRVSYQSDKLILLISYVARPYVIPPNTSSLVSFGSGEAPPYISGLNSSYNYRIPTFIITEDRVREVF